MKQNIRDILINGLGGVVTTAILLFIGSVSGFLKLDSSNIMIKIFASLLYIILLSWVVYVFRAKKAAQVSPNILLPIFSRNLKIVASVSGLIGTVVFIWSMFFAFSPQSPEVPPLIIKLSNSSKTDVVVEATVDFELLEGARVTLGTTVAKGAMDLFSDEGKKQEFITIPAESSVFVLGYFREPEMLLPFLKKGNTDIWLMMYKGGGGLIINPSPFRFDKDLLEKYRMELEVSE
jgi:hypothetical protein